MFLSSVYKYSIIFWENGKKLTYFLIFVIAIYNKNSIFVILKNLVSDLAEYRQKKQAKEKAAKHSVYKSMTMA